MPPRVVNMIPASRSGETSQDSEPNLAVDPSNPLRIAGSAFTPDQATASGTSPIYVSQDGGENWELNPIVPGRDPTYGTWDITVRFATAGGTLYAGILRVPPSIGLRLNILRATDFTASTTMTVLLDRDTSPGPDQPYIQAATVLGGAGAGNDRVYVGNNDRPGTATRTSTVDYGLDARNATPPPPSGFLTRIVETRTTPSQDGFACRPAIHWDGTVYAAFLAWRSFTAGGIASDICIVRDDNWGSGATPFSDLVESSTPPGDGGVGVRAVRGVTLPSGGSIGQNRLNSSMLTIAVDPRSSATVYVAWGDVVSGTPTLHVRRSGDHGASWSSADIKTVTNAVNPALAINSRGKLGFLYQRLAGTAPNTTWDTHLELTTDDWATAPQDFVLCTTPSAVPASTSNVYLGDYLHLLAIGKNFYGIFSASNVPDNSYFPQGVRYQRTANFTTHQLLNGTMPVNPSIDPFFVRQTELAADADFYVRDWTLSPTDADNGAEPSTYPWFFVGPDVWNRQSDTPGAFNANDQPAGEDAAAGLMTAGDNFAFARVRRNAAGAPATVTAHFLVSPLGTGSSFQDAGTAADPTLAFGAADTVLTMANGYRWHLDPTMSNHVCLAVEISTPSDPIVLPSLLGRAPGWPQTDLSVLLDNNKAQRNVHVAGAGSAGSVTMFGLVHNAGLARRDMHLRLEAPDGAVPKIRVVGGGGKVGGGSIVLPGMEPGENRWIAFAVTAKGLEQAVLVELVGNTPVNGFAVRPTRMSDAELTVDNLRRHAWACTRFAAAFGLSDAEEIAKQAFELATVTRLSPKRYLRFAAEQLDALAAWAKRVAADSERGDPFGIFDTLGLAASAAARGDRAAFLPLHATLLHELDAFQTMLLKDAGDAADIIQTVEWQERLCRTRTLAGVGGVKELLADSRDYIEAFRARRVGVEAYSELVRRQLGVLASVANRVKAPGELVDRLEGALGRGAALQGAHRALLLHAAAVADPGE